jgi:hypothetical protein
MKTKHLLITSLTAISLATGSSSALAAGFVIDTFDLPSNPNFPPPGSPPGFPPFVFFSGGQAGTQVFSGLPLNETIGGVRNFEYRLDAPNAGAAPLSIGRLVTGSGNFDGYLDISNNNQAASTTELMYSDLNAAGIDQGNFNTLQGNNSKKGIVIEQISDGIPFRYTLEIGDGMGNVSSFEKEFDFDGDLTTTTKAQFTFQEILDNGPAGFDLSDVNYVKLIVNGNIGYDLSISQIGTFEVPEPSTLLGLLAVLGTGAFSIKRIKKED